MESLGRCVSPADIRRTLSPFPRSIEGIYKQALQRILAAPEPRDELGLRVLQWVVFANRPLSMHDLQYALATCPKAGVFDPDAIIPEETLLSLTEGLVVVENKPVFKHPSSTSMLSKVLVPHARLIREFSALTPSFVLIPSPDYTAKDALTALLLQHDPSAHTLLASACVARLKSCNFPQSQVSSIDAFVHVFRDKPLLRYAYLEWPYHMLASPTGVSAAEQFVLSCTSFPVNMEQWHHHDLLSLSIRLVGMACTTRFRI